MWCVCVCERDKEHVRMCMCLCVNVCVRLLRQPTHTDVRVDDVIHRRILCVAHWNETCTCSHQAMHPYSVSTEGL